MTIVKKALIAFLVTGILFSLVLIGATINKVQANPSFYPQPASFSTATSTGQFMTPGTGTTTVVYDSYCISGTNQPICGNTNAINSAALLLQFSASTTASALSVRFEYSQDGIDWYGDGYVNVATTTIPVGITINTSFNWTFASSTVGGMAGGLAGIGGTNNRDNKIIKVVTPTRFVRAIITLTGANATIWSQIQPLKENN